MSDWQTQVDKLLADYEGITHERYATGLAAFRAWYLQSYPDEPDAALLTDDEVRDYRVYLTGVKGYKAATVNAYLAPIRAIVRAQGRMLKVKGVKQVQKPVETLDARDLGRLINAVDGPHWSDKRDVALINVMARAGLRVSEALALRVDDVELGPRSGKLLVREGKGLKSRTLALSSEARDALKAYLIATAAHPVSHWQKFRTSEALRLQGDARLLRQHRRPAGRPDRDRPGRHPSQPGDSEGDGAAGAHTGFPATALLCWLD